MKKLFVLLFCLLMTLTLFACGDLSVTRENGSTIACTSFVVADWVEELLGDEREYKVKVLGDDGKDMHNFQPSASDMREVLTSELFIYIGGESDKWAEGVDLSDTNVGTLRLFDIVEALYCDDFAETHNHAHHDAPDEHIWLSFENTLACIKTISETLCEIDPENADKYRAVLCEYEGRVTELYKEYQDSVALAKHRTLVFADRFPFVYLVNELGVEYAAAFPGCSSETTASFETVISLAQKVDEYGLPCVIVLEDSEDGIAETVINNTSSKTAQIISLNSMQIYRANADFDYLETMSHNLSSLKVALGCD